MPPRDRQRPTGRSMLSPAPEPITVAAEAAPSSSTDVVDEPLVHMSVRVPHSLREELRHQALREHRSLQAVLIDASRAYLDGAHERA